MNMNESPIESKTGTLARQSYAEAMGKSARRTDGSTINLVLSEKPSNYGTLAHGSSVKPAASVFRLLAF
ncbi:MAG: hypothetical protein NT013_23245 [Planctomycetia bacterium]|nr:hypothetical protein [Planctomycetia bacterium]